MSKQLDMTQSHHWSKTYDDLVKIMQNVPREWSDPAKKIYNECSRNVDSVGLNFEVTDKLRKMGWYYA